MNLDSCNLPKPRGSVFILTENTRLSASPFSVEISKLLENSAQVIDEVFLDVSNVLSHVGL